MANKLRFDQRHGFAELPTQLQREEVSTELRAKLWAILHQSMVENKSYPNFGKPIVGEKWNALLYRWHVDVLHWPSDRFNPEFESCVLRVRSILYDAAWFQMYTFLELIPDHYMWTDERWQIAAALEECGAAWRLVDDEIVPITSEENAEAVVSAIATVSAQGPAGAKAHLRNAAQRIAAGEWPDSVRESIHAVESVARTFESASSLGQALKSMERSGKAIHPALAKGLSALYGYSSDESGIRHALLEKEASAVTENEALFMFGACASFCQYLINAAKVV